MRITSAKIIRVSGLAAIAAGTIYIGIQALHPLDMLESVTTTRWAVTHYLSMAMDMLALLGVAGLYAKQVHKAGLLGLIGYLLFSLFWLFSFAFHLVEAFIEPSLVLQAPQYVAGLLGLVTSTASEVSLGIFPLVYSLTGLVGYALGGLVFAIATIRTGILPRLAGGLLAIGILLPLLTHSFVQHPFDRILAVPVGLALIWLGYSLWSQRQTKVA